MIDKRLPVILIQCSTIPQSRAFSPRRPKSQLIVPTTKVGIVGTEELKLIFVLRCINSTKVKGLFFKYGF